MMKLLGVLLCLLAVAADQAAEPLTAHSPNILFAIADDWGVHAGAYGTPWVKTPAFDRVAREGILFNHAYTPNAKCAPVAGLHSHGAQLLAAQGGGKSHLLFPAGVQRLGRGAGGARLVRRPHAERLGARRGHQRGRPAAPDDRPGLQPAQGHAAHHRHQQQRLRRELRGLPRRRARRTSLGASGTAPSSRIAATSSAPAWPRAGKRLADIDRVPGYWPDNDTVRNDMLDYAFEVEHFDRHLGRMLAALEKRGLLENTLVIVTSDHGMPFPRVKGNAYEFANHVPFAAMWKRGIAKPGRVVDDFVSFIDLAPTFIELAGLKWSETGMAESPGRSLDGHFPLRQVRRGQSRARPRADRQGAHRHRPSARLGLSDARHRARWLALPAQLRALALAGGQSGDRLPGLRRRRRRRRSSSTRTGRIRPIRTGRSASA